MNLKTSLVIYFLILIFTVVLLKLASYRTFSAFLLATLMAQITLNILYPPTNDNLSTDIDSSTTLYFFVQIFGIIIFVIYALMMALSDYEESESKKMKRRFAPFYIID